MKIDYFQPAFYRFNEDSLWLVDIVATWLKKTILVESTALNTLVDIGSGCGVIGLELYQHQFPIQKIVLLEPFLEFQSYLHKNVELKRSSEDRTLLETTIMPFQQWPRSDDWKFPGKMLIVANPPYFRQGQGRASPDSKRNHCRQWDLTQWEEWSSFLFQVSSRAQTKIFWTGRSPPDFEVEKIAARGAVSLYSLGEL